MSRRASESLMLTMAALVLMGLSGCSKEKATAPVAASGPPPAPTLEQLKGATVSGVFDQPVTLVNGVYHGEPAAPGAASHPMLALWEPTVHFGDVDATAGDEAIAMFSATTGGTGEFVHLAVFGIRDGALANLGTAAVGDRVKLQALWLERGKILMDVIEAGPGDAACCPTQVARKTYGFEGGALKQLSSEVRGVVAVSMLAANEWQLVEMDGQPMPAGIEPPLVHFEGDTVRGFAGCNRFTASVKETRPGEIDVGPAAATRMACPPPQMELEQKFLTQLDAVNRYTYLAGQLALGWQDKDKGGILVFRK